ERDIGHVARQLVIDASVMVAGNAFALLRDGADDGEVMRHLSGERQVLADLDACRRCLNWRELTTEFRGSSRLHVKRVDMTGPALQKDQDARTLFCASAAGGASLQQVGQRQGAEAHAAGTKKTAPRDVAHGGSHGRTLLELRGSGELVGPGC